MIEPYSVYNPKRDKFYAAISVLDDNTHKRLSYITPYYNNDEDINDTNNNIQNIIKKMIDNIYFGLKSAFIEQNGVYFDCKTLADMKEKYEQGLKRAKKMNVPTDDLSEYKRYSKEIIFTWHLGQIPFYKTSTDMKKELENGLKIAKEIGLSDGQIEIYKKEAEKMISKRIKAEEMLDIIKNENKTNAQPKIGFLKKLGKLIWH